MTRCGERVAILVIFLVAACNDKRAEVELVGCVTSGQQGMFAGLPTVRRDLGSSDLGSGKVALYTTANGHSIYAPRDWRCRAFNGPSGTTLVVSRELTNSADPEPQSLDDAIEVSWITAEGSGRFTVASYTARLFPDQTAAFTQAVRAEAVALGMPIDTSLFADDILQNVGLSDAEFTTPANTSGMGTDMYLRAANTPIRGAAWLNAASPATPGLTVLRMRLGDSFDDKTMTALLHLNKSCIGGGGCG